jgi:LUD domain
MQTECQFDFTTPATDAVLRKAAAAMTANNIEAVVVDDGGEARRRVLELVPEGSEVHSGKSKTIEDLGLLEDFGSGRYDWVRGRYMKLDRRTQGREIRKISATPDYMLGSVQAVTEDGVLVLASYSASQIGPIAGGAGRVILVVGSHKLVPDLDTAVRRVREHVMPYEDARLREQMGVGTKLAKLLFVYSEPLPGRTTVFLVREPVGF